MSIVLSAVGAAGLLLLSLAGAQYLHTHKQEVDRLLTLAATSHEFARATEALLQHGISPGPGHPYLEGLEAFRLALAPLGASRPEALDAARHVETLAQRFARTSAAGTNQLPGEPRLSEQDRLAVESLANLVSAMEVSLDDAVRERYDQFATDASRVGAGVTALTLLFGALCLTAFVLIHRRIALPARSLTETLERIRAGDACAQATFGNHAVPAMVSATLNEVSDDRQATEPSIERREMQLNQAFNDLAAARDRLIRAQQVGRIGSWEVTYPDERLEWSDQALNIFGARREELGTTVADFFERVHPDDREWLEQKRLDWLAKGGEFEAEYRIVRPGGEIRWLRARAQRDGTPDGTLHHTRGTIQDITENRLQHQELAKYRTLLEHSEDLCGIVDEAGRYIWVNRAYAAFFKREPAELIGRTVGDLLGRDHFEAEILPRIKAAVAGESTRFEATRKGPDGVEHTVLVRYYLIEPKDNSQPEIGFVITDLTEIREAERKMEEASRLLEITGDVSRAGGWTVELDEGRVTWTDRTADLHAMPRGHSPTIDEAIEFYAAEHRDRIRSLFSGCVEQGQPFNAELQIIDANGERRWVRSVGEPVRDSNGRITGARGIFQDISDARQLELERIQLTERLATTLESITEGFTSLDRNWRYTYVNPAAEQIGEKSADELLGTSIWDQFQIAGTPLETALRTAMEEGQPGFAEIHYEPLEKWVEFRTFPTEEGIAVFGRDITDAKLAQLRLEQQAQLLEIAGRAARFGGWRVDLDDDHVEWSDVVAEIHAMPQGHRPSIREAIDFFVPGHREQVETAFAAATEEGSPYDQELQIIDNNGARRWIRLVAEAVRDDEGNIVAVQGAFQDITGTKELESEHEQLAIRLDALFEGMNDGYVTFDRDWRITYANPACLKMWNSTAEETIGKVLWDHLPHIVSYPVKAELERVMRERSPGAILQHDSVLGAWFDLRIYPLEDGLAVFFQDQTEVQELVESLKAREEELRQSHQQLSIALDIRHRLINSLPAQVAMLDREGRIIEINREWQRYGEQGDNPDPSFGLASNYIEICEAATDDEDFDGHGVAEDLRRVLDGSKAGFEIEYPCHSPDRQQWFRLVCSPVMHDGERNGAVVMHVDITERKLAERELEKIAFNDPLSGVLTRSGFDRRLEPEVWQPNSAVVIFDVVGMGDINEAHGYDAGDQVLKAIAARMTNHDRVDGRVARIAGDEFAAFVVPPSGTALEETLSSIEGSVTQPLELAGGSRMEIRIRGGYTMLGDRVRDVESLIREAELALFESRSDGSMHSTWVEYLPEFSTQARDRIQLTAELRNALEHEEFELHYQPKVDLRDGRLVAAEALIRWNHPERGLQPPHQFIPVAEQSQMIGPIGNWALREACRELKRWQSEGLDVVRISVNVSLVQFLIGDFPAEVRRALDDFGVEPEALSLEITESVFERHSERLIGAMRQLHEIGVRLSLDDFGTGYSSLRYLQLYPFDEIKIDRAFTAGVLSDRFSRDIVRSVINIANAISAETVAEGIESPEIGRAVRQLGCAVGQGFYFSVPLETEDFRWLLERRSPLPLRKK